MNYDSENRDKLDTIDLIITALKDHEKRLDSVYDKLESLVDKLSIVVPEKIGEPEKIDAPERISGVFPIVSCDNWQDFKYRCKGCDVTAFDTKNNTFFVYVKLKGEVFRYSEKIPRNSFKIVNEGKRYLIEKIYVENIEDLPLFSGTLRCGLNLSIKTSKIDMADGEFLLKVEGELDPVRVKEFLSKELSIPKNIIVEGKITF